MFIELDRPISENRMEDKHQRKRKTRLKDRGEVKELITKEVRGQNEFVYSSRGQNLIRVVASVGRVYCCILLFYARMAVRRIDITEILLFGKNYLIISLLMSRFGTLYQKAENDFNKTSMEYCLFYFKKLFQRSK